MFYIKYPLFYFEIIDQQAIPFANPSGSKGKEWRRIGFSRNKRSYCAIEVNVNGENVQTTQLSASNRIYSQLERNSNNDGKLLIDRMEELPFESRTIGGLHLIYFVFWNRYPSNLCRIFLLKGSAKCFGGPIFEDQNEILLYGIALKFSAIFFKNMY